MRWTSLGMVSSSLLPFNGAFPQSAPRRPTIFFRRELRRGQDARVAVPGTALRTRSRAFQVLANPNVSEGKDNSGNEIIMVDPLEAKRLAAKQMQQFKAKEKLKRRRRIEAINGAWAMLGLTAGLVIEGHTGNGILAQLAGYWHAILAIGKACTFCAVDEGL